MSDNKETELKKLQNLLSLGAKFGPTKGINFMQALDELKQKWFEEFRQTLPQQNVDVDALAQAVIERIPAQVPADMDIVAGKVAEVLKPALFSQLNNAVQESELRIANKLAESIDSLQRFVVQEVEKAKVASDGKPIDTQAILAGVFELSKPVIVDACQKTSQAVMESNFQALQAEIYRVLEEKMKEMQPQQQAGSGGGGIIGALLNNPEVIGKFLDKILGTPAVAPQTAFVADFGRMMSFHDLMTKIEKRTATGEEITKGLANIASPNPAIPQITPGQAQGNQ